MLAAGLISAMHVEMPPKLLRKAILSRSAFIRPMPQPTTVIFAQDDPSMALACGKLRHSLKGLVQKTASQYVADYYLWNSGNFLFHAATMWKEIEQFEPPRAISIF